MYSTHGFVDFENVQLFERLFLILINHKLFYRQLYHHRVILFLTEWKSMGLFWDFIGDFWDVAHCAWLAEDG